MAEARFGFIYGGVGGSGAWQRVKRDIVSIWIEGVDDGILGAAGVVVRFLGRERLFELDSSCGEFIASFADIGDGKGSVWWGGRGLDWLDFLFFF